MSCSVEIAQSFGNVDRWLSLFAFTRLMALYNDFYKSALSQTESHLIRYPTKSSPACRRIPQLSVHQLINQYILSMLMCQTFTPADWQTIEHRW